MGNRWQQYEPTPEEVEAARDRIRDAWPEAERQRRAVGGENQPAAVPIVSEQDLELDPT